MSENMDDRWLDVLAGRAKATDRATRQASSLRTYFELQAADDLATAPDPQVEKRIMNALRAKGAFSEVAQPQAPKPGLVKSVLEWLFPTGGGHMGRYAAVATVAFAVVVGPMVMRDVGNDANDTGSVKSAPGAPARGAPAAGEAVVMSGQPAVEATQLVAALAGAGVDARVTAEGADQVVRARIAPDRAAAAAASLASIGMAAPASGDLVVRFKTLP